MFHTTFNVNTYIRLLMSTSYTTLKTKIAYQTLKKLYGNQYAI